MQIHQDFCNETNLREFAHFLVSAIGPRGHFKSFVSPTGHLTITRTSERMLKSLEVTDLCVEAVIVAVKSYLERPNHDFGLTLGYLTSEFTLILKKFDLDLKHSMLLPIFSEILRKSFESAEIEADFADIRLLMGLTRSILSSKRLISKSMLENHCIHVVKAFLSSIPAKDGQKLVPVHVNVVHGQTDDVEVLSGVLHYYPEINIDSRWQWKPLNDQRVKILVLNLQIKEDLCDLNELEGICSEYSAKDVRSSLLRSKVEKLLQLCIEHKISIVANQKVVEEEIRQLFWKRGVLFLERLGTLTTKNLLDLSGAKLVTFMKFDSEMMEANFGEVDTVERLVKNGKSYLRFCKEQSPCITFWAEHFNEELCEEISVSFLITSFDIYFLVLRIQRLA